MFICLGSIEKYNELTHGIQLNRLEECFVFILEQEYLCCDLHIVPVSIQLQNYQMNQHVDHHKKYLFNNFQQKLP